MEVTRQNFDRLWPQIEDSMRNAVFIAFDFEFLGLQLDLSSALSLFDSASDRFGKHRKAVANFPPCQLGLATFSLNKNNEFIANVFNVYLFRRFPLNSNFVCSVSAVDFLRKHKFDFNKFVKEGVSYANANMINTIEEFLQNGRYSQNKFGVALINALHQSSSLIGGFVHSEKNLLEIVHDNLSWTDKLILFYALQQRFNDLRFSIDEIDRKIYVHRPSSNVNSPPDQSELLSRILDEFVGAAKILQTLIDIKVPLIGHNCLIDLLYLQHHFHSNVTAGYSKWKQSLTRLFPVIYDTKYLATLFKEELSLNGINGSSLEHLHQSVNSSSELNEMSRTYRPLVVLSSQTRERYENETCYHEAGYDALKTGEVFLRFAHMSTVRASSDSSLSARFSWPKLQFNIRPLANRLCLPSASVAFINLIGTDPSSTSTIKSITVSRLNVLPIDVESIECELQAFGQNRCECRKLSITTALISTNSKATYMRLLNHFTNHNQFAINDVPLTDSKWKHIGFNSVLGICGFLLTVSCAYFASRKTSLSL